MNDQLKRFVFFGIGLFFFAGVTSVLAFSVTYKPFGVHDTQREEFEERVAEIKRRNDIIQNVDKDARPVFAVDNDSFDFGRVDPHSTHSHAFKITNRGGDPLTLKIQQTSCKCTLGELGQGVLLPGESTDVTLTWNTGYKDESYEQTATLVTNDPLNKSVTLKVSGVVRSDMVVPESVVFTRVAVGEDATANILLYSQRFDSFSVEDVVSKLPDLEWSVEPVDASDAELADRDSKSAWRIRLSFPARKSGGFSDQLKVLVRIAGNAEPVEHTVAASGSTKSAIAFFSPDIDHNGLDIGTLVSGKAHQFSLTVRLRNEKSRILDVLDVEPKELRASLTPNQQEGVYKLTITVPKDCPMVSFDREDKHGFVQVGDPKDKDFQNWFPLYGAVVRLEE